MNERSYFSAFRGEPEVMTVVEAAKLLRIGKNKAYELVNNGRLSSIKVGGKTLVPKVCLVSFLTDTNNYRFSTQFVPDNSWTSDKKSDIVDSATTNGIADGVSGIKLNLQAN